MNLAHAPTLYRLCGKIAAGKSTLARRLAARPATLLISEDHWTSNLFADDPKTIETTAVIRRVALRTVAPGSARSAASSLSFLPDRVRRPTAGLPYPENIAGRARPG